MELRVAKRLAEKYTPPPKRSTAAFGGSGNRLGSPAPAVTSVASGSASGSAMPGSFPGGGSSENASGEGPIGSDRPSMNTMFEVDQSLPTTSVQIRLADGTMSVSVLY